jgi:hypothetical protein
MRPSGEAMPFFCVFARQVQRAVACAAVMVAMLAPVLPESAHASEPVNPRSNSEQPKPSRKVPPSRVSPDTDRDASSPVRKPNAPSRDKSRARDKSHNKTHTSAAPISPCPQISICGPDVTTELKDALDRTKKAFATWDATKRKEACDALTSTRRSPSGKRYGEIAWDVVELHNQAWILNYQEASPGTLGCATEGATPACIKSVQVGSECYYAGSVNYALFGVMFKLCYDNFSSNPRQADEYSKGIMLILIDLYKGPVGPRGAIDPGAPNFIPSQQWAVAGYEGWPAPLVVAPPGDRSNCAPICPTPYDGRRFTVRWLFENGTPEYL